MSNGALHPSHKPAVRLRLKGAADPEKPPASAWGVPYRTQQYDAPTPASSGAYPPEARDGGPVSVNLSLPQRLFRAGGGGCCMRPPTPALAIETAADVSLCTGARIPTENPQTAGGDGRTCRCPVRRGSFNTALHVTGGFFLPSTGSPLRPDEPSGAVSTCSDMISTQPLRSNHGQRK
mgnify:CR=1 FL=1